MAALGKRRRKKKEALYIVPGQSKGTLTWLSGKPRYYVGVMDQDTVRQSDIVSSASTH